MKARIISTGSYKPKMKVSNDDLASIMDTNDEWIRQRTGIKTRLFSDLSTSEMGYQAALDAIESGNIDKNEIDVIILCTLTPDQLSPSCANKVASLLELERDIPSFDINAACSGFVYGLKIAQAFIESNAYETALVIGCEHLSKVIDFKQRSTAVLFGDGAGAAILRKDSTGIISTNIYNKDDEKNALSVHSDYDVNVPFSDYEYQSKAHIQMEGQEVFKFASKVLVTMLKDCLKENNLTFDDIKYVVPHQANLRIIEFASKVLKIDSTKIVVNVDQVGNTSAASVPMALDEINKAHKLQKGDKIILVAFGSGLTYGISLIEW